MAGEESRDHAFAMGEVTGSVKAMAAQLVGLETAMREGFRQTQERQNEMSVRLDAKIDNQQKVLESKMSEREAAAALRDASISARVQFVERFVWVLFGGGATIGIIYAALPLIRELLAK